MSESAPLRRRVSRRGFLIGLGAGAILIGAAGAAGLPVVRLRLHQQLLLGEDAPAAVPESPFVWVEIAPDNQTKLFIPKVEMGQGVHTALAQIAADELELDWALVEVHQADLARGFAAATMFTFGSTSVTALYQPIREAAATLREMLRAEAALQLGHPLEAVIAQASSCRTTGSPEQVLGYGAIIAAKQGPWRVPDTPPSLKPATAFTLIGRSVPRVDLYEKLTGRSIYGYDARLPDMLYGAVARPPRYGARLRRAAPGAAADHPGVIQVVLADDFAGVVAHTRTQARAAVQMLDLEWEGGTTIGQAELEQLVTVPASGGVVIQRTGDVDAAFREGTVVRAEYRTPLAAHATLEAQAALADVGPDQITVYTSTQVPGVARDFIARAVERDPAQVNIVPTYLGAAFGRKGGHDVGVEAVRLAAAVGRPVHVGWTMTEELRHGYFRPLTHNQLRARLTADGSIAALEHQVASGDVAFHFPEMVPGGEFVMRLLGADPFTALGALLHYAVPHQRVALHRAALPIPTSFWRGLGLLPNVFALESFIDELAHVAGADPLQFRLRHLPDDDNGRRLRGVLEAAAARAGWGAAPPGRGQGIACCWLGGTVVAEVAEVSVEAGAIQVHRVTVAVDPGLVVNPDIATAQVQGSIVMGLSATLRERVEVANGMATLSNLDAYSLFSIRETPEIAVELLSTSDRPLGGMGEPAIGPVGAAVANAVFACAGIRLQTLPLRLSEQP